MYLELLKERERREPKKFLKCHFFNTFFYKKVSSMPSKLNLSFKVIQLLARLLYMLRVQG